MHLIFLALLNKSIFLGVKCTECQNFRQFVYFATQRYICQPDCIASKISGSYLNAIIDYCNGYKITVCQAEAKRCYFTNISVKFDDVDNVTVD